LLGFLRVVSRLLDNLAEHPLQRGSFKPYGSCLYSENLRTEGLNLEPIPLQLLGNACKYNHLFRFQLHQQRHEESLALNLLHIPIPQNFFKKNSFMGHMLVNNPQSVLARGQNE